MTTVAKPLDEILEKEFQQQVFELAQLTGWSRSYHTHDSRRSASGFPDIVLVRERVIFAELKREKTRLSPAQKEWLRELDQAGAEVYVVRPRNLDSLATVLTARTRYGEFPSDPRGELARRAQHELREALREELG